MRKAEIVQRIAEETGLTNVKAEEVVNSVFSETKSTLEQGESIILRRFGTFEVRDKRARPGRNPKTGESADIPAHRMVRVKSVNAFKAAANESMPESVTDQI